MFASPAPVVQGRPAPKSEEAQPYAPKAEPKAGSEAKSGGGGGSGKGKGKGWGWAPPWAFGWGKGGKGWKGGWGGGPSQTKVPTVPADFTVDTEARFTGTVTFYNKWKGFGFITLKQEGVVPNNVLFVQWRNIQSKDRFPFLVKDLEVEFGVQKWKEQARWGGAGGTTLRAKTVTLPGGLDIAVQDEIDGSKKEFIGNQSTRYSGNLKFYSPKTGYGYITIDPNPQLGADVPAEIRVERSEVNAGGKQPSWMSSTQVEFGIWKTTKGAYKAYNVTLPGGHPLTQPALENRMVMGPEEYKGIIEIWNWRQGWGFLKVKPGTTLPSNVQAKLTQQTLAAREKAESKGKTGTAQDELIYFRRTDVKPGSRLRKEQEITFQIYTDDKGVGAMEIAPIEAAS